MNILLINQPLGNRGDESAHKALIRTLNKTYPKSHITILNFFDYYNAEKDFIVENKNNHYVNFLPAHALKAHFLYVLFMKTGIEKLGTILHPALKKLIPYFKNSDVVINAPGGICMGGFQNWRHLYLLAIAKAYEKPLFYYSRSFGPFPTTTWSNRRFKSISMKMLKYFDFLSIRDAKTMKIADELGISYVPSIDTAFLEQPCANIPKTISDYLKNEYIVFVPNSLTWHYAFKNYSQETIDNFYLKIAAIIRHHFPQHQIVMLPQLCSQDSKGDYQYFTNLANKFKDNNVLVLPDTYNSDIQQTIIKNATLMVGARYHSVVFAINNETSLIALNYEHKIAGLLEILGLSDRKIDIEHIFDSKEKVDIACSSFYKMIENIKDNGDALEKARQIANNCFYRMTQKIN